MLLRFILYFPVLFIVLLLSCQQPPQQAINQSQKDSVVASYFPYHPRFDVKDTVNNTNLQAVLQFWKTYERGNLDSLQHLFSDTVAYIRGDKTYKEPASDMLSRYKAERARLRYVQCHIDFWRVVYVAEKRENWVLLWAQREGTLYNGSLDSKAVHQVWRFNRNGRAYSLAEYRSAFQW